MSNFIKAAVIGHPIKHSKSPLIHNYWIKKYGLAGSYEAIDLAPDELEQGLHDLIARGFTGFNFTIPHKQAVMALCDEVDRSAQDIGAVNSVHVCDGKLKGFNTDAFGFLHNIKAACPDFRFNAGAAIVLGAGGAARAVIHGLLEEGTPQIILSNRTRTKAEALAQDARIKVIDWDARAQILGEANLLVNTTALGMDGQPALEIDLSNLPSTALVNDIVYAPLHTPLLRAAKKRGCTVVTGIGMLLHQARPAFREWFGMMPDVDEVLKGVVIS